MSRAALLPTPGDPFLVSYWLRHFRTWAEHVDRLYVCQSFPQEPDVEARIRADVEAVGGRMVEGGYFTEHGLAMQALLAASTEDVLLFIEDDFYIREPDVVRRAFAVIEDSEGDIVGIPRGSMGQEILRACLKRYPIPGPCLWPTMLVSTADRFRAITETFSARVYAPGDVIKGVGYIVQGSNESADTFGAAAMEMQDGARMLAFPDFHAVHSRGLGPYIHIGSLSSGPDPARCGNLEGQSAQSWAIRTSWWRRFHRAWPGGLDTEHGLYGEWVDWLVRHWGAGLVDKWTTVGDTYVTWDER